MTKQIGKTVDDKWAIVEDKVVLQIFDTKEEAIAVLKVAAVPKEERHHHEWDHKLVWRFMVLPSGSRVWDQYSVLFCSCGASKSDPQNDDAWAIKTLGVTFEEVSEEDAEEHERHLGWREKRWREKK